MVRLCGGRWNFAYRSNSTEERGNSTRIGSELLQFYIGARPRAGRFQAFLTPFKGVAIARLHGSGDALPHGYRVGGLALQESP
jgi:hypothetical protein